MTTTPFTIMLATGGTGGHIFPAESLAEVLISRGHHVVLVTDKRFEAYRQRGHTTLATIPIHEIPASSLSGNAFKKARSAAWNVVSCIKARRIINKLSPDVVIGFGGYPSFPTMLAAAGCTRTIIHEQNAILGKANRMLAPRVDVIATSFQETQRIRVQDAGKVQYVGNPVRAAVKALRDVPYPHLHPDGMMRVLITGGSQGAAIFGDILPKAVALLPEALRQRLRIDQQVRAEQADDLRKAYDAIGVQAELAPFFSDVPTRLAGAHLVIARSGASTVAELTCAARPAILVPLPHSADDHQKINALTLDDAGGSWMIPQSAFTPETLSARLESFLNLPAALNRASDVARTFGRPQSAEALADMVCQTASTPYKRRPAPVDALPEQSLPMKAA